MSDSGAKGKAALTSVAAAIVLGSLLAGCGVSGTSTNGTANKTGTGTASSLHMGGSITLDTTSNFQHFDPAISYFSVDNEVVDEVYETLLTYNGPKAVLGRGLAANWSVSSDGKTYTFQIRHGVSFTNGDPVTAQSFVDEFERVLGKGGINSPGEGFVDPIIVGSTDYHNHKATAIRGLSTPDPYTLVIKLTKPEPFFPMVIAMPFFSAVDQKYITSVGANAFDVNKAMGTGPFMLQTATGNTVVLVKNSHYWKTDSAGNHLPYLDKVTINVNKNGTVDALHFEQGSTAVIGNLFGGIPSSSFPIFEQNPKLKKTLVSEAQNEVWFIGQSSKYAPFSNPKVRVALEYAIDKKKIVQLENGRGQVANQPLPPGIDGYMNSLPENVDYTYDPAKAKQLLAAAGYPNGFTTTLYSMNDPDFVKITNSIQNDLETIGIKCNIRMLDDNEYWTEAEQGKFPLFIGGWVQDFPDPSDFLNTLLNGNEAPYNNMTWYNNPQVNAWLNQAQTDTNQTERSALYNKVTLQMLSDGPWIPLYYPVDYSAAQTWVHGFYISPVLPDPLQYMWVDAGHSAG